MDEQIRYGTLQQQFPDEYIATRGREVIARAPSFEQLWSILRQAAVDKRTITVEWVEAADVLCVY